MIRINQLKLAINHSESDLKKAVLKALRIDEGQLKGYKIFKRSIDARKKHEVKYIYAIDADVKDENKVLQKCKNPNATHAVTNHYHYTITGEKKLAHRPVVVGSGPAGLFAAYFLAKAGYKPLLIERGQRVEERIESVEAFWKGAPLNPNSNVQFGEGGAGTFSDGKLNTLVKDTYGRIREVLSTFVEHGANEDILYVNKPHIGTDELRGIVKNIREDIIAFGGEVRFGTKLTSLMCEGDTLTAIEVEDVTTGKKEEISCEALVLAIGHSARDTFEVLYKQGVYMERKPFAVGLRMEHPQELISKNQYGDAYKKLPAADYKVTHKCENGKGVYSFCMCPGGFVVNASSEEGRLVVNGMSNHDRAERNANSAIVVTVDEEDFMKIPGAKDTPLAGMEFQRYYEKLAYECGKGKIPVQLYKDLLNNEKSAKIGRVIPNLKGEYTLANLRECIPDVVCDSIIEGVTAFDRMIPGFADGDSILSGVEMRTSSPVRISRDESGQANVKGIYPCGEGAGYAGGITSAAVDGIKVFESMIALYNGVTE